PAAAPEAAPAAAEGTAAAKAAQPVNDQVSAETVVEILEFSDFQCPFCSKVGPTLTELKATYGAKLRVEFLHQPLS
ncbi:MAG TPA: DsbA family protein, partial [Myxococcota bacterium]|nr:DsbA family protein [Myxococcota bacterium]